MAEYPTDPLALRRAATPDRIGLIDADSGETYSYATLDDAAGRVAAWTETEFADKRPTVALLADRHPAVAPLLWGGLRAGARVALLDVTLPAGALADRFERVDGDALVCEAATRDSASAVDAPVLADVDGADDASGLTLDPFQASAGEDATGDGGGAGGELLAFTSGTTGDPKGVRLDLATLVASGVASTLRLGATRRDRWLVPIPTYHVGGVAPILRTTQAGTTAVYLPGFEASRTIECIEDLRITAVSVVPTQLTRLLDSGWDPPDTLRFVLVGGGPVPPDLIERCGERGVPVCPTYGTTETASQVATARPAAATTHPGTVGRPLAFTDVTVLGEEGPCEAGTVGELVVDGPTVTPGYLESGRRGAAFDEHGFHTGDRGYADEAGRLWIVGRLDDRIVTGGEVVDATRVAEAVRTLEGVADVAVVGLEDPEWGERVGALVERRTGAELSEAAVRSQCRKQLASHAVPKTVSIVTRLPRTASGTVDRARAKRELQGISE